jgi:hypothetical protein
VDAGAVQTNYTSVAFVQQPTNTLVNTSISPSPTVQLLETDTLLTSNNTDAVNGASVPLYYSGTATQIATPANLTETTSGGVATYSGLAPNTPSAGVTLAVGATGTGLQVLSGTTLTATSNAFEVIGQATKLAVSGPPTATAGTSFSITVTAQDAANNTVTDYTGTVTFSSTDTGVGRLLPANYTFTAGDNGVHTFSNGATLVTAGN